MSGKAKMQKSCLSEKLMRNCPPLERPSLPIFSCIALSQWFSVLQGDRDKTSLRTVQDGSLSLSGHL